MRHQINLGRSESFRHRSHCVSELKISFEHFFCKRSVNLTLTGPYKVQLRSSLHFFDFHFTRLTLLCFSRLFHHTSLFVRTCFIALLSSPGLLSHMLHHTSCISFCSGLIADILISYPAKFTLTLF